MTYAAKISALDDLITATASCSPYEDARRFKHLKDAALKTIKVQQHVRVNQFDVHARLEGLVEKFFVLTNEPLSDALKLRLDELAQTSSKWKPEILALLLALSDRPVENTNVDEALRIHVSEPEPQLTWAEIIADDPLTEEGVWDDIEVESDYSEHRAPSPGDVSVADHTTSTQASSVNEEDLAAFASTFVISPDTDTLEQVKDLRTRLTNLRHEPALTELQCIRQVLSMLHGLPSDLFDLSNGQIRARSSCNVTGVAPSTAEQTLRHFAAVGCQLSVARAFVGSSRSSYILQRLQAAVQGQLRDFGKALSSIEQKYLHPDNAAVVSLISVQAEIDNVSRTLVRLTSILPGKTKSTATPALDVLNRLHDETCILHLIGEEEEFASFARLFFDCLHIYLRPVLLWMTEGKLEESSNDSFFVNSDDEQNDLGSIWHSRYSILKNDDGTVCAPWFMQHIATRVFKAGKSVRFLEALGKGPDTTALFHLTHRFDTQSILDSMTDTLQPFSEVLKIDLVQWLDAQEGPGTQTLLKTLNSQCGLYATVKAMNHLYLGRHGAHSQTLAYGIFARIDRGSGWADRFLLTELAQNAFDKVPDVDASHISVRIRQSDDRGSSANRRRADMLDCIILDYSIPWSIQNVLTTETLVVCQQTFSVLLRLQRAQYLLNQQEWTLSILAGQSEREEVRKLLALRQRLAWFCGILRSYFSDMVSLAIHQLTRDLDQSADVDDLAKSFIDFQHNLASKLLLQKNLEPIRRAMLSILELCEDLAAAWTATVQHISNETSNPTSRHVVVRKSCSSHVDTRNDDESSEDEEDKTDHQQMSEESVMGVPNALKEYDGQLAFALAGLRGVSRVEGEPAWIMLSEKLQLGSEVDKRR